jgi:hypothetical protein
MIKLLLMGGGRKKRRGGSHSTGELIREKKGDKRE